MVDLRAIGKPTGTNSSIGDNMWWNEVLLFDSVIADVVCVVAAQCLPRLKSAEKMQGETIVENMKISAY